MNRVVITGMGSISALGLDTKAFMQALFSGQEGIAPIEQVDCNSYRFQQGAEVRGYEPKDHFESGELTWLDRFSQFALIAADEAISNAGLKPGDFDVKSGVITGTCVGGQATLEHNYKRFYGEGKRNYHPNVVPNIMANAPISHIASKYGIKGPSYTVSTACASSTHAIGQAFGMIRQGLLTKVVTGGSEALFTPGHLRAWEALRVISGDTCRPFCQSRSGMILGEGAGMLVLESLSSALDRGASIYAELRGFGMSADAGHLTHPDTAGQQYALRTALSDGGLVPHEVQYINAHGTGTHVNDKVETQTIKAVFSTTSDIPWVSATKSAHGHLLGAAGAIESIATILALKHQTIPPTLNYKAQDADCDLPLVVNEAKACEIENALCTSYAFGGLNAVLAFKRFEQ